MPRISFAFFTRSFLAERDRWALWLPAALGLGIGIYFALDAEPSLYLAVGFGGAGLLVAAAAAGSPEPAWRMGLMLLAALLIGFCVAKIRTQIVAAPVLGHRLGPTAIDGLVESAEPHGKGARLLLSHLSIAGLVPDETPARVRISQRYGTEILKPGVRVHLTAVLLPPPDPAAPGDYDFGRWAYYEQIGAVGYAYGKPHLTGDGEAGWFDGSARWLEGLRAIITARILSVIPGEEGAISAALITGERGAISQDDQDAYRDSGLSHVLSISGLHLALAGGIFFWVMRALLATIPWIALQYPIKKWAAVAALAGAGFYYLISGGGAAAQRSFIMLALMFAAILADRPALTMRNVALAAGLILLFAPESLIEPGFEMSFGAVIGLIALAEWDAARKMRKPRDLPPTWLGRLGRYALDVVLASLVAGIATAPFAIYHFDRASQYGVLANLAALPIVGFVIMPAATAAMVLMPFGLDRWALIVMGHGVAGMTWVARTVAALPGAATLVPAWPEIAVLLAVLGGLWICFWRKRWRWLGLAPVAVGLLLTGSNTPPDILVSRDAGTVATRASDGRLAFLRPPSDDYAAESWLRRSGDSRRPEQAVGTVAGGIRCDTLGCIARRRGGEDVAFVLRAEALGEDCAQAVIVVSAVPVRERCKGPKLVIDRFDVSREGAHAVWLENPIRVETAQQIRGRRPWNTTPRQ